jgi:precorrin-6A synthase
MRKLYIIGIGSGNPEHITVQAIKALNKVDVFFVMNKGDAKNDLVRLRKEICERYIDLASYRTVEIVDPRRDPSIDSYTRRVEAWHQERALIYEDLIRKELKEGECGAFLVWGDPSLYDSTLRVIDHIIALGRVHFDYEVIPGITSIQALAARHKITLNGIGESICITTGRRLSPGLVASTENVVVMLDGKSSFKEVLDEGVEIYWGAYVGSDKEILLSGKLTEELENIEVARNAARKQNGWVMDTYLLRNPSARRS